MKKLILLVVVSLLIFIAGCLGFGEKEITPNELPQDYPITYEWHFAPYEEKNLFVLTNTGQIVLSNGRVKIEKKGEDGYNFTLFLLGDINPGETKVMNIEKDNWPPTKITVWHEDIKSWMVVHPKISKPAPMSTITNPVEGTTIKLPVEEWNKTFGGDNFDIAHSIYVTKDGGYILIGETKSYGTGKSDIWLIKTDASGNQQWNRTFGGGEEDGAKSVHQTYDDGYIFAGFTASYGAGDYDAWLIKVDQDGNLQWNKTFGGKGYDSASSVYQTSDGGYILAGGTESYGAGKRDAWLIKTDSKGNQQWEKTFGGIYEDLVWSVQHASDDGYILAGETELEDGNYDAWLIKIDANGNLQWKNSFGGELSDEAISVQQTSGGGYIFIGETESYGAGKRNIWLVKTDENGNEQWNNTFGGAGYDEAGSVYQTSKGNYIIAGSTESYGAGGYDAWLINTDINGNLQWSKTFGGTGDEGADSVQQISDGGYILAGYTVSYGANGDVWLVKISNE